MSRSTGGLVGELAIPPMQEESRPKAMERKASQLGLLRLLDEWRQSEAVVYDGGFQLIVF